MGSWFRPIFHNFHNLPALQHWQFLTKETKKEHKEFECEMESVMISEIRYLFHVRFVQFLIT